MMSKIGVRPERDLRFAMELFAKHLPRGRNK